MMLQMLHLFLAVEFTCLRAAPDARRKPRPLLQARIAYGSATVNLQSSVPTCLPPMPMPQSKQRDFAPSSLCLFWIDFINRTRKISEPRCGSLLVYFFVTKNRKKALQIGAFVVYLMAVSSSEVFSGFPRFSLQVLP